MQNNRIGTWSHLDLAIHHLNTYFAFIIQMSHIIKSLTANLISLFQFRSYISWSGLFNIHLNRSYFPLCSGIIIQHHIRSSGPNQNSKFLLPPRDHEAKTHTHSNLCHEISRKTFFKTYYNLLNSYDRSNITSTYNIISTTFVMHQLQYIMTRVKKFVKPDYNFSICHRWIIS